MRSRIAVSYLLIAAVASPAVAEAAGFDLESIDTFGYLPIRKVEKHSDLLRESIVLVAQGNPQKAFEASLKEIKAGRCTYQTARIASCTYRSKEEAIALSNALIEALRRPATEPAAWYGLLFTYERYFWDKVGQQTDLTFVWSKLVENRPRLDALAANSVWISSALCSALQPFTPSAGIKPALVYVNNHGGGDEFKILISNAMNYDTDRSLLINPKKDPKWTTYGQRNIDMLNEILGRKPDLSDALYQRCKAYALFGRGAEARRDASRFVELGRGLPWQKSAIQKYLKTSSYRSSFQFKPGKG